METKNLEFGGTLAALESECPKFVDKEDWQQCIKDSRSFLEKWGSLARTYGWTARELFGLHKPPEEPHQSYRRLSRLDETGLLWLLKGREVVSLSKTSAEIFNKKTGATTTFRRKVLAP